MTDSSNNPARPVDGRALSNAAVNSRTYICGPMTGIKNLNFPAFHAAASAQRAAGHEVINPAEINGGDGELAACAEMSSAQLALHWQACMRQDIAMLMTCNRIVMLDGWTRSRGAALEHQIARALGFEVCEAGAAL